MTDIVTHESTWYPLYQLFVYARPTQSKRGKPAYVSAVQTEAKRRIASVIKNNDVEVSVIYSTSRKVKIRKDVDNILKPTLDALCGIAYHDDRQVRAVSARLFDRLEPLMMWSHNELAIGLVNPVMYPGCEDAVIIHIYSKTLLQTLDLANVKERLKQEALEESERLFNTNRP